MRKIIYIANIRLPTEKAHGIQIMKTCEALASSGVKVELVVPRRHNRITDDPFTYYRVKKLFNISSFFSFDLVALGKIGFFIQSLTFSLALAMRFSGGKNGKDVVFYTRDELPAYALSFLGNRVVWETHMGHNNFFIRSLIRRGVKIVAISGGLGDYYRSLGAKNIFVSPDGVDLEQFQIQLSRAEARARLKLSTDVKITMYTGHLYSWKGADVLAQSASKLGGRISVIFVGGTENDIKSFSGKFGEMENVMILGNKPHDEIPIYLRAADVLVIPNSAKEKISQLYTSPMKLFEYMASGTPIVASDLPSLREILNEKNSILVNPDSPDDLAAGIVTALSDPEKANTFAKQASLDVMKYDWSERANGIINYVFSNEL